MSKIAQKQSKSQERVNEINVSIESLIQDFENYSTVDNCFIYKNNKPIKEINELTKSYSNLFTSLSNSFSEVFKILPPFKTQIDNFQTNFQTRETNYNKTIRAYK